MLSAGNIFTPMLVVLMSSCFVYHLPRKLLCQIYYLSQTSTTWGFSHHGFDPELWPLTLTWGRGWAADTVLCFKHFISFCKKTCPQTPPETRVREKKSGDVMSMWGVDFLNIPCFIRRLQSDYRHFLCVLVMDWWMSEGDVKWNAPWSQVRVQLCCNSLTH